MKTFPSIRTIDIILNIRPNNVFSALYHTRTLMQQRALRLAMRKHGHTAHDRLNRVSVNNAFFNTRNEEGRLPAFELIIEVDEESEE